MLLTRLKIKAVLHKFMPEQLNEDAIRSEVLKK